MNYREVAAYFGVSEATVRQGRGVFARLRRVTLTVGHKGKAGRVGIPRGDVEKLGREMEQASRALVEVVPLMERRKRA